VIKNLTIHVLTQCMGIW